jgi:hypothetical protein
MARKARIDAAGAVHHVIGRGTNRQAMSHAALRGKTPVNNNGYSMFEASFSYFHGRPQYPLFTFGAVIIRVSEQL